MKDNRDAMTRDGCLNLKFVLATRRRLLLLSVPAVFASAPVAAGMLDRLRIDGADNLLPPERAFRFRIEAAGPKTLLATFEPALGYALYRDRIQLSITDSVGVALKAVDVPRGEVTDDPKFGKVEVFRKPVAVRLELERRNDARSVQIVAVYQGCHERRGVCYPPSTSTTKLKLP